MIRHRPQALDDPFLLVRRFDGLAGESNLKALSFLIHTKPNLPDIPQTQIGLTQAGGLNVFSMRNDAYLVTVLGEAPPSTVRQIAQSVSRR